ncbi:hypothetical protein BO94DRAFT_356452 [Aspergillus sclerotioniger CBS 115572]|uniref:Uncharacterized protein n=1 Tax=Aspergillus sclerotioniger CBS 115572 TaxID=1450535 RepID=A0A317UWX4_9EURO|nr:hypothetical protein BO94DRAFT_356452 [Aspergillus sclerotioniger CBS 115572]PWY65012.1 hypothetical protein BO94DRAFT_356452 [Aspergillus sclerotioniger CBS 115572]
MQRKLPLSTWARASHSMYLHHSLCTLTARTLYVERPSVYLRCTIGLSIHNVNISGAQALLPYKEA